MDFFRSFYQGKKVFITGHTGFKGSWLAYILNLLGAEVSGYALDPAPESFYNLIHLEKYMHSEIANICDRRRLESSISAFCPDIVFHLAAQPMVLSSYKEPAETVDTNVTGTSNVLDACRNVDSIKSIVVITTDKVYENKEWVWRYRETDPLGGYDLYSASKAAAEIITRGYYRSFYKDLNTGIATVRAGNVIGGGDFGSYRLIPDIIRAIQTGQVLKIRYPQAVRPWQHVFEPLIGYLLLGGLLHESPKRYSDCFNLGPDQATQVNVADILAHFCSRYLDLKVEIEKSEHHETSLLQLDSDRAKQELGWKPLLSFETALQMTMEWYDCYLADPSQIQSISDKQLNSFFLQWKEYHASN